MIGFKVQPALTFFVGPQLAFLASQKSTLTATNLATGETASGTDTNTDGLRKTLLGGNIGAGYNITPNVGVNLNYAFDFQHAADSNVNDTGERNSGFALTLSYLF